MTLHHFTLMSWYVTLPFKPMSWYVTLHFKQMSWHMTLHHFIQIFFLCRVTSFIILKCMSLLGVAQQWRKQTNKQNSYKQTLSFVCPTGIPCLQLSYVMVCDLAVHTDVMVCDLAFPTVIGYVTLHHLTQTCHDLWPCNEDVSLHHLTLTCHNLCLCTSYSCHDLWPCIISY